MHHSILLNTGFIIFVTKVIILNTKFITFDTKLIILNAEFIIFDANMVTLMQSHRKFMMKKRSAGLFIIF